MESDARTLFNLVEENRTYLREWLPWLDETTSVQDEVNFIQEQTAKHQTADGSLFLIESLDVGVIGTLSVNQVDHGNLTAWIG